MGMLCEVDTSEDGEKIGFKEMVGIAIGKRENGEEHLQMF
jgi:hypothetical protein